MKGDRKEYDKKRYQKNKEYIKERVKEYRLKNKEYIKEHMKEYHSRPLVKEQRKKYRLKAKERTKEHQKKWFLKNREYINKYYRERNRTVPNFRLRNNLGGRVWKALKGLSKSASTMKLIGCTIEELWVHLESSPKWESWMTRENYGRSGGWDIDHVKAMAKFNLTYPRQQHACCHWSNLQPMEHVANMKKGSR